MKNEHYLFVNCPFGGTEIFMKNLKLYADGRNDITCHWVEVPRLAASEAGRAGSIKNNWSVRASRQTFLAIRDLQRRGITIRAAFFNHLTAVSLLLWYRQRIPCVLSLDTTPVLMDLDRQWYGRDGFQTKGPARLLSHRWTCRTYAAMRFLLPWSQFTRDSLTRDYGIASDQSMVLPPGIDLTSWKPTNGGVKSNGHPLTVLFVGGDFVRKGGDVLMNLATTETFRDCEFHFVTSSFSGPTTPNVHIHTGVKPNSDTLVNLYRTSDVFVLPTKADYAPTNAVVEALASGLPAITTSVGGLGEMIHDGVNGFVVEGNVEGQLHQRLAQLKSNPGTLASMKRDARKFAETTFDINRSGSTIIDLLRGIR